MAESNREYNPPESRGPLSLISMSVVGVGLGYATSIVAARLLGPSAFEDYAVALATLSLLGVVAEAGVGKYALKTLPGYVASGQWSLASGYWRFSVRIVLFISILLSVFVALWEGLEDSNFGDHPIGIAAYFLPAFALSGVGIDLVMANRAPIAGMFIAQVLLPATTLCILLIAGKWLFDFTATVAILCYGSASIAGVLFCTVAFLWSSPQLQLFAKPEYQRSKWLPECFYFAACSFLASWTLKISLVVLELLPIANSEVSCFAAAIETGCLILLLSKSTDKLFQPELSIIMARKSWRAGTRMRNSRYVLVGFGCSGFMLIILLFGKKILGLYGAEFIAGYPALCFVALGSCLATMFSLAPAFLRFSGHNRFVLKTTICGAILMAVMTACLGFQYGATGAGIAFCATLALVSLMFLFKANKHESFLTGSAAEHPI